MRDALPSDAERIRALAGQLGYQVSVEHVRTVLEHRLPGSAVLVAVVPRVGVVGWIGLRIRATLTSPLRVDIEGLVVEDEYRGHGIGELLLAQAQERGRDSGCAEVRVLSNVVRERAHRFYRRLGYDLRKTEHLFCKRVDS